MALVPMACLPPLPTPTSPQGRVARAALGISPAPDSVAKAFGVTSGVVIQAVDPGGAAERAGLLGNRRGLRGVVAGERCIGCRERPSAGGGASAPVPREMRPQLPPIRSARAAPLCRHWQATSSWPLAAAAWPPCSTCPLCSTSVPRVRIWR